MYATHRACELPLVMPQIAPSGRRRATPGRTRHRPMRTPSRWLRLAGGDPTDGGARPPGGNGNRAECCEP